MFFVHATSSCSWVTSFKLCAAFSYHYACSSCPCSSFPSSCFFFLFPYFYTFLISTGLHTSLLAFTIYFVTLSHKICTLFWLLSFCHYSSHCFCRVVGCLFTLNSIYFHFFLPPMQILPSRYLCIECLLLILLQRVIPYRSLSGCLAISLEIHTFVVISSVTVFVFVVSVAVAVSIVTVTSAVSHASTIPQHFAMRRPVDLNPATAANIPSRAPLVKQLPHSHSYIGFSPSCT